MLIRDLFVSDVTRDIPPVVYFHEQSPEKLAAEVSEYIITGGWPEDHPNHRRVPDGIHEQYVRLLTASSRSSTSRGAGAAERLDLRLLRLGQVELREAARPRARRRRTARRHVARRGAPRRDTSPRRRSCATPGGSSGRRSTRSPSCSTSAASRATTSTSTRRLSARSSGGSATAAPSRSSPTSSSSSSATASGRASRRSAQETLGQPWAEAKDKQLAEEDFSLVMSRCSRRSTPTR